MKSIFIIHSNMEIGGAETSLLGLLNSIDYKEYTVDLMLLNPVGELMKMIPKKVNIIDTPKEYLNLGISIKKAIINKCFFIVAARLVGKLAANYQYKVKKHKSIGYLTKQYSHKYAIKFLPNIDKKYDLAISFIDPHYIVQKKVNATVKMGWLPTDFSRIEVNKKDDYKMWDGCDYIVSVSDLCKKVFDDRYPELINKSIVIENILPKNFVINQSNKKSVDNEMSSFEKSINICSVGRFSEQKNFDSIPNICKRVMKSGYKIKWYIIGYGTEEEKIRKEIEKENMTNNVIILGKKENPYPYIKACDIYIQPSRYEGKAVTVREAQMLNKPVIITNFATAKSQLKDGFDGIIVPMDNKGCAEGIVSLIKNKELQNKLILNTKSMDYSNSNEINKIYKLIK